MTTAKPLTTEIYAMSPHLTDLFAAFCRSFLAELPQNKGQQLPLQLAPPPWPEVHHDASTAPRCSPPSAPDDLMPLRDAARMAHRGSSTVRGWIADGKLIAHRGKGTHPTNAPVMVSLAAVIALGSPRRRLPSVVTDRPSIVRRDGQTAYKYLNNGYIAIARRGFRHAEFEEEDGQTIVWLTEAEVRNVSAIAEYMRNNRSGLK